MTALDDLRRAMTRDLTKLDKVLLLLGYAGQVERRISDLKQTAGDIGMPEVSKWNISHYLSRSSGMAIKSGQGWILTSMAAAHLEGLILNVYSSFGACGMAAVSAGPTPV